MRICFYAASCGPLESENLDLKRLQPTERAILSLAKTLASEHEVFIVTSHLQPRSDKIKFIQVKDLETVGPVDIYSVIKDWIPIFYRIEARSKSLWIPRGADEFSNMGVGDLRVIKAMDFLLVSEDLDRDGLAHVAGIPREKIKVLGDPELESGLSWNDVARRFVEFHTRSHQEKSL